MNKITQVMLCEALLDDNPDKRYYCLCVVDDDRRMIAQIPLVSSMGTTGMNIQKWKYSKRKRDKDRNVIAVYYWISSMGHELDQWRYYDLDLEEDVTQSREKR